MRNHHHLPVSNTNENDDLNERVARALQLQFDLEDEARYSRNVAPPIEVISDGELAMRLDQEMKDEEYARSTMDLENSHVGTTPVSMVEDTGNDAVLAKKVQQELSDEELAMRLQQEEETLPMSVSSAGTLDDVGHAIDHGRSRRCTYRTLAYLITIPLVLGAVFSLVYMFAGGDTPSNPIFPGFPVFPDVLIHGGGDNYNEINGTLYPWRSNTKGQGLEMTIANALSEQWHPFFYKAVKSWDEGNPDILTLTTIETREDPNCSPIQGMIKVCNGNYGHTDWKGINEVIVNNKYIVSSIAKVNEYYEPTFTNGEREYLLCHELGHGFGLPHQDEVFNNRDLGTCMDYTVRPESNLTPNQKDFELLFSIYGSVPKNRFLSRFFSNEKKMMDFDIPDVSFANANDINNNGIDRRELWRTVYDQGHKKVFELDLGDGMKMRSHVLLA